MSTKAELLEALDTVEKQFGAIIEEACGTHLVDNGVEPMALQQARIRYGEGSLWLRYWIDKDNA
jgi:hypothetical protein